MESQNTEHAEPTARVVEKTREDAERIATLEALLGAAERYCPAWLARQIGNALDRIEG